MQQQKKLMPQHLVVFASGQKQKEKQKKMKNTKSTKWAVYSACLI